MTHQKLYDLLPDFDKVAPNWSSFLEVSSRRHVGCSTGLISTIETEDLRLIVEHNIIQTKSKSQIKFD
jgi:hypothetical protein